MNRGLAYAEGNIFLQQADTTLVALDTKTGEVMWKAVDGDPKVGETNTNAPVVIKDMVFTGIDGGEFRVRGFLAADNLCLSQGTRRPGCTARQAEKLRSPGAARLHD